VAGVDIAVSTGKQTGIEVLPAVELSVQFKTWQDVHLLGYGINIADVRFLKSLTVSGNAANIVIWTFWNVSTPC
jgi:predicted metal-dependent phosphoesterase TrpH